MNADRIAPWYRVFEYGAFGRSLERRRYEFLDTAAKRNRALVLGDGDGRFIAALLKRNPEMEIDIVELSAVMLDLCRQRVGPRHGVRFHLADACGFEPPPPSYDLIATHFFLDCLPQQECDSLIQRMAGHAAPGAAWIISEFHQPAAGWPSVWAGFWIRLCYLFFRLTTGLSTKRIPEYAPALERAGFRLQTRVISRTGLLVSDFWTNIRSLS